MTGISTGALIAPFAFAGKKYDATLKEVYTTTSPDDVMVIIASTCRHGTS